MIFHFKETVPFLGVLSLVSGMKFSKSQKKGTCLVFSSDGNPYNIHNGLKYYIYDWNYKSKHFKIAQ